MKKDGPFVAAMRLPLDDQILLITTGYRFLLTTARQLADLREARLSIRNIHRFAGDETVAMMIDWSSARMMERLLLATSTGYIRAYPLNTLRPAIEAPLPLSFDDPPPGVPVAAQGTSKDMDVIVVTNGGRAVRWPLAKVPLTGVQAINPGRGDAFDRVAAALVTEPEAEVVLILADGYARRLRAEWVEEAVKANAKGKATVARRAAVVALAPAGSLTLVTDWRTVVVDGGALPLDDSTKAYRLVKLAEGELVTAVVRDRES